MLKNVKSVSRSKAIGTSLDGYVTATYSQLQSMFGKPIVGSGDGKVRREWVLDIAGAIITIYDYKDSTPISKIIEWHVGGRAGATTILGAISGLRTRPA